MEHPSITKTLKTGYPNLVSKPEHLGSDYFGDEILNSDDVVVDPNCGEIILKDNLDKYLSEVYGFKFMKEE